MASRTRNFSNNKKTSFLLLLLLFVLFCPSTSSSLVLMSNSQGKKLTFIEKLNSLIQRQFLKCTLVFTSFENDHQHFIDSYNRKNYYNYYDDPETDSETPVSRNIISIVVRNDETKTQSHSENRDRNFIYRLSSRCVVPIIFITTSTAVHEHLWKINFPVWDSRLNEDKFIFVLLENHRGRKSRLIDQNQNERDFFSSSFMKVIKYKLFLRTVENRNLVHNEKWKLSTLSPHKLSNSPYYYNLENMAIVDIPEKDGILPDESSLFPDYEADLGGKIMRLAIHRLAGRAEVEELEDGSLKLKRGMYSTACIYAGKHFNFSIQVIPNRDGAPGIRQKNGTWTGAIGDIISGRADFSLPNGVTLGRYAEIDFSHIMETTSLAALSGAQLPIYSWKSIFWPFRPFLWFLIIISTTFLIFSLWSYTIPIPMNLEVTDSHEDVESGHSSRSHSQRGRMALQTPKTPQSTKVNGSKDHQETSTVTSNQWSIDIIIMFLVSILLEQGGPTIPDLMKITCLCWILFTMIIGCAYRSKLVTLMTFPVTPKTPDSFEELAASDFRPILLYYGGSEYYLLKTSTKKHLVKIYNEMDKDKNIFNCHIRVIGRKESCITYYQTLEYIKARYLSDSYGRKLHLSHHKEFFIMIGFGWAKGAVFANFNKYVDGFVQGGFNDYWLRLDFRDLRHQRVNKEKAGGKSVVDQMGLNVIHVEDMEDTLSLKHLRGAFFVFSLGVFVSLISFFKEKMFVTVIIVIGKLLVKIRRVKNTKA